VVWLVPFSDHFCITIMPKLTAVKKDKEIKIPIRKGTKVRLLKPHDKSYPSYKEGDIAVILNKQESQDNKGKELLLYVAIIRRFNGHHWNFSSNAQKFLISEDEFEIIEPVNKKPKSSKTLICEVCETRKNRELFKKYKGFLICDNCFDNHFRYCRNCEKCIPHSDSYDINDEDNEVVCRECYEEYYSRCNRCERLFLNDDDEIHNGMCSYCRDEYNNSHNIIMPDDKRFIDKSTQDRDLPIGVEIEAELKDSDNYDTIIDSLRNTGCGICEDGSLDNGIEIQIPASNNGITERLVNNVCRVLKRHCYIDDKCGLHIHIGYPSDLTAIKNAIIMAYISEPIFYGINPRSRMYSHFCQPIRRDFNLKEILNVKPDTIDKLLYSKHFGKDIKKKSIESYKKEKYNSCRYSGFNLHSHFYRGTLEFRYHAGTIDPVKIMNWANLLKTILIYAKKYFIKKNVLEIEHSKTYEERSGRLFNMIGLSGNLKRYFTERYQKFNKAKNEIEKKIEERGGVSSEQVQRPEEFFGTALFDETEGIVPAGRPRSIIREELEIDEDEARNRYRWYSNTPPSQNPPASQNPPDISESDISEIADELRL